MARTANQGEARRARSWTRPRSTLGWKTSDADEIALRGWRGRTETVEIEAHDAEARAPMARSGCRSALRRRLRGGDPRPRRPRQFLRLRRSSRQWPGNLQAHRRRPVRACSKKLGARAFAAGRRPRARRTSRFFFDREGARDADASAGADAQRLRPRAFPGAFPGSRPAPSSDDPEDDRATGRGGPERAAEHARFRATSGPWIDARAADPRPA